MSGSARPDTTELESFRVLAAQHGVPIDCIDRFALQPGRVARALDVSVRRVRGWISTGALPSVRIGGVVRVQVVDLLRFLEEHRRLGTGNPKAQRQATLRERVGAFVDG
jgi:Helix-turn-helix domain